MSAGGAPGPVARSPVRGAAMPERLILHIGMHKTGTTAIQEALAGYDAQGTRMARLRHPNHSIHMLTCFASDPTRYHVWVRQGLPPDRVLRIREAMRRELADELALPRQQLLISGEEMSLMLPPSIRDMAETLRARSPDVAVLAWLRPAASYIASALQQMIRAGQDHARLPRPSYRARFEAHAATFGRAAMVYRAYHPGASSVGAFCDLVGIPRQEVADRRENVALSETALRLIWLLNRTGPPTTGTPARLAARSATIRHLALRFPGRLDLPAELVAGGIDAADIAWAEAETGLTLSQGLPDIDPDRAQRRLEAWLVDVTDAMDEALDEDLDRLGLAPARLADTAERVSLLYRHYLAVSEAEAEAQEGTVAIFRAGNRDAAAAVRARLASDDP